jgi:hypothetical protein
VEPTARPNVGMEHLAEVGRPHEEVVNSMRGSILTTVIGKRKQNLKTGSLFASIPQVE